MKRMSKYSLVFILLISSVILISSVSAADNMNDADNATLGTEDIETLEIDDADNDAISTDNHENGEGYISFEKDTYEIEENQQNTKIKGTIYYNEAGYPDYNSYFYPLNITCNYTDGNNIERSYIINSQEGKFEFNLNQCEGLVASDSPYILTFSPVNDYYYEVYLDESGNQPLASSWITLTVNGAENNPNTIYVGPDGIDAEGYGTKNNPYKTISYAVSKAEPDYTIYLYEGRYDENSITLTKSLSIVGENKANVVITSTINNRKIFESPYDENGNHVNLRFENLTFDTIKPGMYNAILNLRNEDRTEVINCVFENTDGQYNIWSSASETLIKNCEFRDICYTSSGNLLYLTGKGHQNLTNITFDRISNTGNGILSMINVINKPTIINITCIAIRHSEGTLNGINIGNGGYGNISNALYIKDATFENNEFRKASNNQGGSLIVVSDSAKMEIRNSTITQNTVARGIFAGTSNETQITANYNLIYNNTGAILYSTSSNKPVKDYDMDYNYWGSEDPDLGDLDVNVIATNKELTEMKTIKHKVNPEMNITHADVFEGESMTIEVVLNETATGNITIIGLYDVEPQQLENGRTTFSIPDLLANDYIITISYSGDNNYNPLEREIEITVKEKMIPEISVNPVEIYEGETAELTITLPENATGTLSIYINNNLNTTQDIQSNTINVSFTNLGVGTYNITLSYSGDKQYTSNNKNMNAIVKEKMIPEIRVNTIEIYEGETAELTITLPENATGTLSIYINNTLNTTQDIQSNIVNVNMTNLPVGTNNITIRYSGDKQFKDNTAETEITVKSKIEIENDDITIIDENATTDIALNLPEDATGELTVYVDNETVSYELVNGTVRILETLSVGKHALTISYAGNNKYNGFTIANETITIRNPVEEEALDIAAPNGTDSATYSINLPSNATGNFTVIVDGVAYTQALENGSATVTIPNLAPGEHNITINYSGDENYKSISKTTTIKTNGNTTTNATQTITPAKAPEQTASNVAKKSSKITAKNKTFKAKKKVKKYTITLKSGKKPIKKVQVTLKIKGKTYKAKTNAKGKATFKIKLTKKGKYTAVIKFKGNKDYKETSKKVKITIK